MIARWEHVWGIPPYPHQISSHSGQGIPPYPLSDTSSFCSVTVVTVVTAVTVDQRGESPRALSIDESNETAFRLARRLGAEHADNNLVDTFV